MSMSYVVEFKFYWCCVSLVKFPL